MISVSLNRGNKWESKQNLYIESYSSFYLIFQHTIIEFVGYLYNSFSIFSFEIRHKLKSLYQNCYTYRQYYEQNRISFLLSSNMLNIKLYLLIIVLDTINKKRKRNTFEKYIKLISMNTNLIKTNRINYFHLYLNSSLSTFNLKAS